MRRRVTVLAALLATVALAGCTQDPGGTPGPGSGAAAPPWSAGTGPIEVFHDHTDATLHQGSWNIDQVAWSPLDVELGENGFANFVIHEDGERTLAYVAIDGDQQGGFTIADITDPQDIQVLGSYRAAGSGFQEVRVTPDGRYAVLNVQELPSAATGTDCPVCIHIVDVSDPASPELVGLQPVELIGTHNFHFEEIDGELYLLYVGQPLYVGTLPASNPPPGNEIKIARFVETPTGAQLVPVSSYRHTTAYTSPERSFPHDVLAAPHPITGQVIMYASYWDGGAITVDITDPTVPQELDVHADPAPSQARATHWFAPEPQTRGERMYAWSAPEIGQLDSGSGVIRAYDVTDPGAIAQVGTWTLPGNVTIPGAYIFSPHTAIADEESTLLAVSHYHAGLWVLDITDPSRPREVAYHQPVGDVDEPYTGAYWWKKPNFDPDGFIPNVYQARWHGDLLWITDRSTGLYALRYTGPAPGA